jgi:hypothetical protein
MSAVRHADPLTQRQRRRLADPPAAATCCLLRRKAKRLDSRAADRCVGRVGSPRPPPLPARVTGVGAAAVGRHSHLAAPGDRGGGWEGARRRRFRRRRWTGRSGASASGATRPAAYRPCGSCGTPWLRPAGRTRQDHDGHPARPSRMRGSVRTAGIRVGRWCCDGPSVPFSAGRTGPVPWQAMQAAITGGGRHDGQVRQDWSPRSRLI